MLSMSPLFAKEYSLFTAQEVLPLFVIVDVVNVNGVCTIIVCTSNCRAELGFSTVHRVGQISIAAPAFLLLHKKRFIL